MFREQSSSRRAHFWHPANSRWFIMLNALEMKSFRELEEAGG